MPGILGFTLNGSSSRSEATLSAMQKSVSTKASISDALFCDSWICATRSRGTKLQSQPQPAQSGELYLWLDGEILNSAQLMQTFHLKASTDLELLSVRSEFYLSQPDQRHLLGSSL